ncbi:hypothetical protein ScPMuIL_008693 [Solemya velum]
MAGRDDQDTEITAVKAKYPDQCRVIRDIGEFKYVIAVQPIRDQLVLKFQLPANYPGDSPNIIVGSSSLVTEDVVELNEILIQEAEARLDSPMIIELVQCAEKWFSERPRTLELNEFSVKAPARNKKKKKKKGNNASDIKDDEVLEKKPMKTAYDVVKKILWDSDLLGEDFVVGYLDRFTGIEEKDFSSLNWEDITSTDRSSLALPEHRIHYFKYRGEMVWNKNNRLDNVFGSTGSGLAIAHAIHNKAGGQTNVDTVGKDNNERHDERDEECTVESELLSDARDDEFTAESELLLNGAGIFDHLNEDKKDTRPNYFVALRITNEEIIANVKEVQEYILQQDASFRDCCFTSERLHVTLFAVRLDSEEQVARTKSVLESCRSDLKRMLIHAEPLKLKGLGAFHIKVIHVKVEECENLTRAVDFVRSRLEEELIQTSLSYEVFIPHMTIMNLSRKRARAISKKIYPTLAVLQIFG